MLGKPQLEEEDELVGLVDYGDGPPSSEAKPDSRAEEGVLEFSDTSEPAVGWVGRDVSPGACRRNLSPVPKSIPTDLSYLGASSGGRSAF